MYEPFVHTAAQPLLALVPAVAFTGLALWRRRKLVTAAAITWIAYWLYETGISARILCSGDCAIRADLLLIAPFVLGLSLAALVAAVMRPRAR